MKIDESDRVWLFCPLMDIMNNPSTDDDSEAQFDEDNFWSFTNPDELDVLETDRETLREWREEIQTYGKMYRSDANKLIDTVQDYKTFRSTLELTSSLYEYSFNLGAMYQYAERIQQTKQLEETIAELEPLAAKYPELERTIQKLKAKLHKPGRKSSRPHVSIKPFYNLFCSAYRQISPDYEPVQYRQFINWCNGINRPADFPETWWDAKAIVEFAAVWDKRERRDKAIIPLIADELINRGRKS